MKETAEFDSFTDDQTLIWGFPVNLKRDFWKVYKYLKRVNWVAIKKCMEIIKERGW